MRNYSLYKPQFIGRSIYMIELKNSIKNVYVETKVSQKGNEFSVIVIEFMNGYKISNYINNDQLFILQLLASK